MTINLEMVSDVVCPWCWLGLRRVTSAIEIFGAEKIDFRMRPFQLDASIPSQGVDYKEYMKNKFGDTSKDNKWVQMRQHLEAAGEAENIPFRFEDIPIRPNTFNAHRIIRWAQGQSVDGKSLGPRAAEALFHAYFKRHKDIGDTKILLNIAEQVGLIPEVVEKLFNEDADIKPLQDEEAFYRNLGVSGVPTFIANGKYAIQGAQEVTSLVTFLEQVEAGPPDM
ncbi:DsbA family oxidoreductase [Hirschia litorea]|uniref:DsbA family protein n=1 Tax=Hirschia litorea TaxID=1199156 RepID=A0ABW2IJ65_9PROT